MSKDFWRAIAIVLLLVALGQHIVFNIAIDTLSGKLSEIEKLAEWNNGWVYLEFDKSETNPQPPNKND